MLVGLSFGWMSATPAETRTRPARAIGCAETARWILPTSWRAWPTSTSGTITANSSPPDAARNVGRADDLADAVGDLGQDRVAGEVADPVVDLLEAVDVHDHEREAPLVPLRAVDLAAERLVEVAAVVEAGEGVEVGELPRFAEAARVLDRRRDALGELFEPAHVVVAEPDARVAREDAEPADPPVAAEERHTERLRAPRRPLPPRTRTNARSPGPPAARAPR